MGNAGRAPPRGRKRVLPRGPSSCPRCLTGSPERLTASNPEHVELGRQVRRLLEKAGLLKDPYPKPPVPDEAE
jgi:hypothetical protein